MKYLMRNWFVAILFVLLCSCSKWDDYKKYTSSGETLYTGKIDSLKVFPGKMRVKIKGLLPADAKITKVRIKWNDNKDSAIFNIAKDGRPIAFEKTFPVDEGVKNFNVMTFDKDNNPSLNTSITGFVYGPIYENNLFNRPVTSAFIQADGSVKITWDSFDLSTGAKGSYVTYTNTSDQKVTIYSQVGEPFVLLKSYKQGTGFTYRTYYQPDSLVIDDFFSKYTHRDL